jgi:peptidoglycan/xylan/chitin deacetylase (PgdA/CDA1 family)
LFEGEAVKNKGTMVLLVALILFSAITTLIAVYPALFAPPYPKQVYQPTVPGADERVVCIVFDDGWKSQLNAAPILERFNFHATFALVTSYVSCPDYLSWSAIASLAKKGHDIESHTVSHMNLSRVS